MLAFNAIPVPQFLHSIAHRYLIFEGKLSPGEAFVNDIIPALTEFITFNLNDTPQFFKAQNENLILTDCLVTGLQSQPFQANLSGNIEIVAVQIKSPGLSKLFEIPLKYLINTALPLRDIMGSEADSICEGIKEQQTVRKAIPAIEQFLLKKLIHAKKPSGQQTFLHALKLISDSKGTMSVREISEQTRTSERYLQQLFAEQAGFSPKMYSRIRKFNEVIWYFNSHKKFSPDLIESLGYYDQSHFIHDFKSMAGQSPLSYFKNHPGVNEFFTSL